MYKIDSKRKRNMPDNTPLTPKVDLLTQILNVNLSTPRDLDFKPVPEGYIILGTLSEHAQKAACLGFDFDHEMLGLRKQLIAVGEAHDKLHEEATTEVSKDTCDAYEQMMNPLIARYEELGFLKRAIRVILTTMANQELPKMAECVPTSINYSEGFVVSMLPMPSPTEMIKDLFSSLSELEALMVKDLEEELQEDEMLAAEEPAANAQAENSKALSEETPTNPPANDEELVAPEK